MVKGRMDQLIKILLDDKEELGARDDAAIDLRKYDEPSALEALLKIATSSDQNDEFLADVCGESIATIWIRTNQFNIEQLEAMLPSARREARAVIAENKPEWIK